VLDHAFTDLGRDARGRAVIELRDPADGTGVGLWVDGSHGWVQVYTADDHDGAAYRRSLAVEPMTAPPDAFSSGRDVWVLAPAGQDGDEASASWGISAL
jgi:aldose 1-epimerase